MFNLRAWFLNLVVLACVYAGVTALFSFLLVLGLCCEVCLEYNSLVKVMYTPSQGALPHGSLPDPDHGGHHPGWSCRNSGGGCSLLPEPDPRSGVCCGVCDGGSGLSLLLGCGAGSIQAAWQGVFLHVQPSGAGQAQQPPRVLPQRTPALCSGGVQRSQVRPALTTDQPVFQDMTVVQQDAKEVVKSSDEAT